MQSAAYSFVLCSVHPFNTFLQERRSFVSTLSSLFVQTHCGRMIYMSECNSNIMVNIICDTYNHEKYIADALESFVMQKTNFAFEVLVHDDASTDRTAEIIRDYEKRYPDLIKPIYETENQYSKEDGSLERIQYGRVKGKYIALCEGDDYWTDEYKLQQQYDYMESHQECSLVAHLALTDDLRKHKMRPYTNYDFSSPRNCELSAEQVIKKHILFPTASMFFRKIHYDINADFLKTVRNYDYVYKILFATEGTVYVIPKVMSVYRLGVKGSWTERVGWDDNAIIEHLKNSIEILEQINKYREYKFDDAIKHEILRRKFITLVKLADIQKLKEPPYVRLYKKLPIKKKIGIYLHKYFPTIYFRIRRAYR